MQYSTEALCLDEWQKSFFVTAEASNSTLATLNLEIPVSVSSSVRERIGGEEADAEAFEKMKRHQSESVYTGMYVYTNVVFTVFVSIFCFIMELQSSEPKKQFSVPGKSIQDLQAPEAENIFFAA